MAADFTSKIVDRLQSIAELKPKPQTNFVAPFFTRVLTELQSQTTKLAPEIARRGLDAELQIDGDESGIHLNVSLGDNNVETVMQPAGDGKRFTIGGRSGTSFVLRSNQAFEERRTFTGPGMDAAQFAEYALLSLTRALERRIRALS